jgi:hypothetical protein
VQASTGSRKDTKIARWERSAHEPRISRRQEIGRTEWSPGQLLAPNTERQEEIEGRPGTKTGAWAREPHGRRRPWRHDDTASRKTWSGESGRQLARALLRGRQKKNAKNEPGAEQIHAESRGKRNRADGNKKGALVRDRAERRQAAMEKFYQR